MGVIECGSQGDCMSFITYPGELNRNYVDVKDLKSFINSKLDELAKVKAGYEFRISNIVNQDH
jgi:hypothetical protein